MSLWLRPAFGPWDQWVYVESHCGRTGSNRSWILRTRWRADIDNQRFANPLAGFAGGLHIEPTLETARSDVGDEVIPARLRSLEGLSIGSLAPPRNASVDGVRYGVTLPGHLTAEWTVVPQGWEALAQWAAAEHEWLGSLGLGAAP